MLSISFTYPCSMFVFFSTSLIALDNIISNALCTSINTITRGNRLSFALQLFHYHKVEKVFLNPGNDTVKFSSIGFSILLVNTKIYIFYVTDKACLHIHLINLSSRMSCTVSQAVETLLPLRNT